MDAQGVYECDELLVEERDDNPDEIERVTVVLGTDDSLWLRSYWKQPDGWIPITDPLLIAREGALRLKELLTSVKA